MKYLVAVFFLSCLIESTQAQTISNADVLLTYLNPTQLKSCDGQDDLSIDILNTSASSFDLNSTVSVQLPLGINVLSIASSSFVFDNYDPLNNIYTYAIPNSVLPGSTSSLILTLEVDCDIYDLLDNTSGNSIDVTNDITYNYTIASIPNTLSGTSLSYNIAQANVQTTVPIFNQTITVPNDYSPFVQEVRYDIVGNSTLDEFDVYFDLPAGLIFNQINEININTITYTSGFTAPVLVSGSTYRTTLTASNFGLLNFNTGNVVIIDYEYTPECLSSVQINYWSGIDCFGNSCEFDNDFGFVNMLQDAPNYSYSISNNDLADYCGNTSTVTYTITNNDLVGYTLYNPYIFANFYNGNTWSNFTVNGNPVIGGLPASSTGGTYFDLMNLQTSSGYVLDDWNNDGIYGEIAPGQSYTIQYEVALGVTGLNNCDDAVSTNQVFTTLFFKESVCVPSPWINTGFSSIYFSNYNFSQPTVNVNGGLIDGQNQTIEFCVDRYIDESSYGGLTELLLDDQILFGANITLPCGVTLVNPTMAIWENANGIQSNVSITTTPSGSGTLVNFQSTPGQIPITASHIEGCLLLNTTFACNGCDQLSAFNFEGFGIFENCPTPDLWACESLEICTNCVAQTDCSVEGTIEHTSMTANRTTFGWTNSTMTTQVTQMDVDNAPVGTYNTKGAYACDEINVKAEAEICGGANDFTPYVVYQKPAGVTSSLLDLLNAQVLVNGVPTTANVVSQTDNGSYWVVQFNTLNGPFVDGTLLQLNAQFTVNKATINGVAFPYVFEAEITGAFYTNTQWINNLPPVIPSTNTFLGDYNTPCKYLSDDFEFYKVLEVKNEFDPQLNCGESVEKYMMGIGYIGGQSGDDFPNEFRPFNRFNGTLTYELTIPATIGNVFMTSANVGWTTANVNQVGAFMNITPAGGNWPVFDKIGFQDFYYIRADFDVNCELTGPIEMLPNSIEWTNYLYADAGCQEIESTSNPANCTFVVPNIDFAFLNPIQSAVSPTVDFDVNVSNNSSFGTSYPWMLITYDPLLVNITVPTATAIQWSPNQIFVQVGLIPAYSTMNEIITVSPLNCDVEQVTQITVESGYSCSGYPQTVGVFESGTYCPDEIDILEFTILKSNLNVDLFTSFDEFNPVPLCDGNFSILLQVYNDEKADISDLALQFSQIPGLTLVQTSYNYPIAQGQSFDPITFNWSLVNPSLFTVIPGATSPALGAGFGLNNEGLDADATLNGILANNGLTLFNFYHILLEFETDCTFDPTQELNFVTSGITNCDDPISITTSTFIDFQAIYSDLELSLSFTAEACDEVLNDDIIVNIQNNDVIVHQNLNVQLYCDSDNNGLFDPSVDVYLGVQPVFNGISPILNPGDAATVSFNSDLLLPCSNGVYIAVITDINGCYCAYLDDVDTMFCCDCTVSNPTNPTTASLTATLPQNGGTYMFQYQITGYPLAIRNLTGNPADPSLYVWNMHTSEWIYVDQYFQPCQHLAFDYLNNSIIYMQYNSSVAFPHILDTRLIYPEANQFGEICEEVPCIPDGAEFVCANCVGEGVENLPCGALAEFQFNEPNDLGVSSLENADVEVYPIPAENTITINTGFVIESVQIIDMRGRLFLEKQNINENSLTLDINTLSKATYILKIQDTNGQTHFKQFVK